MSRRDNNQQKMDKTRPIIGIIGGTGQMGKLFRKVFEKHKYIVLISSRRTKLTPEEMIKKSDVVIVSVPIKHTIPLIKSIVPLMRKDQLLMDFTSLKEAPIKAMLKSKSAVVGLHPMFGPGVEKLIGQTIIECPIRSNSHYKHIRKVFEKEKAKIKRSTPVKHDQMMAIIQGMLHFSSITMCHVLKDLGIDVEESLKYTSPVYKLKMDMIGRILNQNPCLYADIELQNKYNTKVINKYIKNQNKLLNKQDKKSFVKYFNEASDYLGSFTSQAEKESNRLISKMVKK